MSTEPLRFYFSFRSPYAWFAAEQLEDVFGDLAVEVDPIGIFPNAELFPNDPTRVPNKQAYLIQDVPRVARRLGLQVVFPDAQDPDWSLSHGAFVEAKAQGAARPFMLAVFRKRWTEGADLGSEAVLGDAAEAAGLDRDTTIAAARDPELRTRAAGAWKQAMEEDGLFGVPSFVYRGRLYWGQDRMQFVRAAIERKSASVHRGEGVRGRTRA